MLFYHGRVNNIKILDLGCGNDKLEGAVGVDIGIKSQADIIHDLNIFPYPFSDNEFDMINADNVIEHLDDVPRVMEEIHRIGKANAVVWIRVPYFRSRWAFIDPTHKHFFTRESFNYFLRGSLFFSRYHYSDAVFEMRRAVFNEGIYSGNVFKRLLVCLANRYPLPYEKIFSAVFPLDELLFELTICK